MKDNESKTKIEIFEDIFDSLPIRSRIEALRDIITSQDPLRKIAEEYFVDNGYAIGDRVIYSVKDWKYLGIIAAKISRDKYSIIDLTLVDGKFPLHGYVFDVMECVKLNCFDSREGTILDYKDLEKFNGEVFLFEMKTFFKNGKEQKQKLLVWSFQDSNDINILRKKKVPLYTPN